MSMNNFWLDKYTFLGMNPKKMYIYFHSDIAGVCFFNYKENPSNTFK